MNFSTIEGHILALAADIYAQPPDPGHTKMAEDVINYWMPVLNLAHGSVVLDMGCGQGFTKEFFEVWGLDWHGITKGPDYLVCRDKGLPVECRDFTFDLADIPDESIDFVFARHALEHSPAPLLTLMEWRRISRGYVGLVLPTLEANVVASRNHYVLLNERQWLALVYRAGFHVMYRNGADEQKETGEYRICLRKGSMAAGPCDYIPFLRDAVSEIPESERALFLQRVANAKLG